MLKRLYAESPIKELDMGLLDTWKNPLQNLVMIVGLVLIILVALIIQKMGI